MWFTEEDVIDIFDTHCQIAVYKDGANLHAHQQGLSRPQTLERKFARRHAQGFEILPKEKEIAPESRELSSTGLEQPCSLPPSNRRNETKAAPSPKVN
jgi:hypothetical protein